jgi:hypothetical protein
VGEKGEVQGAAWKKIFPQLALSPLRGRELERGAEMKKSGVVYLLLTLFGFKVIVNIIARRYNY